MKNNLATKYWHKIRELEKSLNQALKKIEKLEKESVKKDLIIAKQAERIKELEEENRKLKGQGKKMKQYLFKEKNKQPGKTKRGAKKNHKASTRKRPEAESVTEEKTVSLFQCPECETDLGRKDQIGWTERYGIDIPLPIEPIITHYNIARYRCPCCTKYVQGTPQGLFGKSPFGINIMMMVLHMKYRGRATDHYIQETFSTVYGIDLSDGGIHSILERAAILFGSSYEAIKQALRAGKTVYADETGWRVEGENWYAWAFSNKKAVLYSIENTRGGSVPKRILEGFYGVLMKDGYQGYNKVKDVEQALCGVHFLRPIKLLVEIENATQEAKDFYINMVWFYRHARKRHRRCKTDDERIELYHIMKKILERFWKNITYKDPEIEKIRQWWLEKRHEQLLTFLRHKDVDWHNNEAERCIRPFVTRRKICGGSRSSRGAQREAVNMSVVNTIIKQGKSIFETIPVIFQQSLKDDSNQFSIV
jgi:transposase